MSSVSISHHFRRNGVLNIPRASPGSKVLAETLLWKDAQKYHCHFNQAGFHNHLSHHILAAYDLGATPGLLQKIYDEEASYQRPIILEEKDKEITITEDNWSQYLGNDNAYGGFFKFFERRVSTFGALKAVEEFIFSPAANEKGKWMLSRLMGGALHPIILIGHALEFGNDVQIATGIAMTCVTSPIAPELFDFEAELSSKNVDKGLSVLEILSIFESSPTLKPIMPYPRDNVRGFGTLRATLDPASGRVKEMQALCSRFHVDETLTDGEMMSKIEELIWASVLILFSTGKEGHKPRSYINVLEKPAHKARIIKAFLPAMLIISLIRGRPTIKPHLIMQATDKPRPPSQSGSPYKPGKQSIGSPSNDEDYNPWPALIESSIHSSDSHVLKTMRTLVLAAREYGDTQAGLVPGGFKQSKEGSNLEATHEGIEKLDGSIFVKAAGMLLDYMGWTTYGPERDDWDRSGLGWEDAWKDEDK